MVIVDSSFYEHDIKIIQEHGKYYILPNEKETTARFYYSSCYSKHLF